MEVALLEVNDLSVVRRARRGADVKVVDQVSLSVRRGEFVGLLGPNGAGKTSLLRAALGLLPAVSGQSSLAELQPLLRARACAWMPQSREIAWPVSVETLVALGRAPHRAPGAGLDDGDRAAVSRALARMGLEGFRNRPATALSGGEQARVLIARALAQETPLLVADEPAAGLDPARQIELMALFAALAREGRAVVAALHDLGLAVRYCTRLIVLDAGRIVADGHPADVLDDRCLAEVFQIAAYRAETARGPVWQALEVVR